MTWKGRQFPPGPENHRRRPFRQRRARLQLPSQGSGSAGHFLRQRPVRPVPRPGRRPAGQGLHGAGPSRLELEPVDGLRPPACFKPGPPFSHRGNLRPRSHHRRRPGRLVGRDRIRQARRSALLIDDKHRLGGKLVLQTHQFFGSYNAVFAGTRGIDIAAKLEKRAPDLSQRPDLASEHRSGRLQRQESRHPRG